MDRSRRAADAPLAALAANRALLTVTAVAVAAGALVAACAPSSPRAPSGQRTASAQPTPASQTEVDRVLRGAGAAGSGIEVWVPNRQWVEGDPGAEPLVRALEWVAATGSTTTPTGSPTGTVTVWQDPAGDGEVTVAASDDDAELAAALAGLGDEDTLVRDRGDWLVVTGDIVRPLLPAPRTALPPRLTVAEYRELLVRRAHEAAREGDTVGG